jgi:hypothetical protein
MTNVKVADALIREVADASPAETVEKIKTVTAEELHQLDPTSTIHFTDYFNHSFTPDIVLRWPRGVQDERFVYLRMSNSEGELRDDVGRVADHKPMLVTLTPSAHDNRPAAGISLDAAATEADTLVSNLDGLEALGSARSENTVAGLLGTTVARGGRGLMTEDTARRALDSVGSGFAGARELNDEAVAGAARTADHLLRPELAGRINRFLQAIWLGAGGHSDQYPGPLQLGGELDDDSWLYLLGLDDIEDMDFWRRIGKTLRLEQVSRLQAGNPTNLHNLVRANCETLWARACQVVDEDQTLFSDDRTGTTWRWAVDRSVLALKGPRFTAYLAEKKDSLAHIPVTEGSGVAIPELRARARGRHITKVVGRVGQDEIDLANIEHQDVTSSQVLDLLAKTPGAELKVTRATSRAESGHNIALDFTRSTASAMKNAMPPIYPLVTGALPLLRRMDDDEVSSLGEAFDLAKSPDLLSFLNADSSSAVPTEEGASSAGM